MLPFFLPVLVAFVALFSPGPVSQSATITPEFLRGRLEVLKGIHGNRFDGLFARRNGGVSFGGQFISEASLDHIPRVSLPVPSTRCPTAFKCGGVSFGGQFISEASLDHIPRVSLPVPSTRCWWSSPRHFLSSTPSRPDRVQVRTETPSTPPRASSRVRTQSAGQVRGAPWSPAPAGAAVRRLAPLSPSPLRDTSPSPSMAEPSVAEPVFTLPMVRTPQSAWDIPGAIIYQTAAPLRPSNAQVIYATSDSSTTIASIMERPPQRAHLFLLRYGNNSVRFLALRIARPSTSALSPCLTAALSRRSGPIRILSTPPKRRLVRGPTLTLTRTSASPRAVRRACGRQSGTGTIHRLQSTQSQPVYELVSRRSRRTAGSGKQTYFPGPYGGPAEQMCSRPRHSPAPSAPRRIGGADVLL
ncbi:hypothetical protein B0H14DRAFT_3142017 [Mycena olivaceomarginata]|nr:hypothetical protein B0H14DRAFT_3142017 [Mycena olivaceomarginata]